MDNINIPPEAVEAAARAMCHNAYKHLPEMRDVDAYTPDADYWLAQATAAIRAALAAWPGMEHMAGDEAFPFYYLILPLTEPEA